MLAFLLLPLSLLILVRPEGPPWKLGVVGGGYLREVGLRGKTICTGVGLRSLVYRFRPMLVVLVDGYST